MTKDSDVTLLRAASLDRLFDALHRRGYKPVGPTLSGRTIVYGELDSPDDLPIGWTEVQDGGSYRLQRRDDGAYFGFTVGPHSWKQFLFPPERRLWSADRAAAGAPGFDVVPEPEPMERYAFVGVRPCDLAAIGIQGRVFLEGDRVDHAYRALRERAFVVAANCSQAAATCFCVSMGTGPRAERGFDVALTEVIEQDEHYFTVEVGSERGTDLLVDLDTETATDSHLRAAGRAMKRAASQVGRKVETAGLKEMLYDSYEHARWDQVAARCLACGNCTMVCPTCFCSTVGDNSDMNGVHAERWRRWDSCFTTDFSFLHGGSIRKTTRSKYRQWVTHKLATWQDQFGSLGCVGCGRCITWCPVGIDITEEVLAIGTDRPGSNGGKRERPISSR